MLVRINSENAVKLGKKLGLIGLKRVLILEEYDPQFIAIKLLSKISDVELVSILSLANALVSYKLLSRGEDYWMEFAKYFVRNPPKDLYSLPEIMLDFMKNSNGNKLFIEKKYQRLKILRDSGFLMKLKENFNYYINDLNMLRFHLAMNMNTDANSKTIVFSIKMLYYGFRASTGVVIPLPMNIPIPIDFRIATMSYITNIIDTDHEKKSLNEIAEIIMRNYKNAQEAWNIVAHTSQIPPLHIDSIIWPLLSIARENNYNQQHTLSSSVKFFLNIWKDLDKETLLDILITMFKRL
ncbi:MAG: N-glycosylase/DNA lyase [Thermoprotei archaeon]|jgi:DNA-(apurinic or apyrimidinic site) lyase